MNCQHSPSCFLRELPKVGGPFSVALAVHAIVWHITAITARYANESETKS
jgi:hypothetical protein